MGMPRVAGWFLIGLFIPICGMVVGLAMASTGATPATMLPTVTTTTGVLWAVLFLLRRWGTTSAYYDPHHAHRLFTPYHDQR